MLRCVLDHVHVVCGEARNPSLSQEVNGVGDSPWLLFPALPLLALLALDLFVLRPTFSAHIHFAQFFHNIVEELAWRAEWFLAFGADQLDFLGC